MNNEDMVLDMDRFDFNSIDSGDVEVIVDDTSEGETLEEELDTETEDEEFSEEDEDLEDDDEADEEGLDEGGIDVFQKALDVLPEDVEIVVGGVQMTGGELKKLAQTREDTIATYNAIDEFARGLVAREQNIVAKIAVANTETDRQLEQVYKVLNDPEMLNKVDVAQLQRQRIVLEQRKKDLEEASKEAMEDFNKQKHDSYVFAIEATKRQLGGEKVGTELINEAANYLQSQGVQDLTFFLAGMSPTLVKTIISAKKYQELENANNARLTKAKEGKKVRSVSASKPASQKASVNKEKMRVLNEIKKGKWSDKTYDFLED